MQLMVSLMDMPTFTKGNIGRMASSLSEFSNWVFYQDKVFGATLPRAVSHPQVCDHNGPWSGYLNALPFCSDCYINT
jgi:hypothetical protein